MEREIFFVKDTTTADRGILKIVFRQSPPRYVINHIANYLGHEWDAPNDRLYRFWCCPSKRVPDIKITLAKQALHRIGYKRYDEVFEDPNSCWSCDEHSGSDSIPSNI